MAREFNKGIQLSANEECSKCRFFKKNIECFAPDHCRRYPPIVISMTAYGDEVKQSYPQMMPNDWCGEFRFTDKFIDLIARYKEKQ